MDLGELYAWKKKQEEQDGAAAASQVLSVVASLLSVLGNILKAPLIFIGCALPALFVMFSWNWVGSWIGLEPIGYLTSWGATFILVYFLKGSKRGV